jgi:hypothetical protein
VAHLSACFSARFGTARELYSAIPRAGIRSFLVGYLCYPSFGFGDLVSSYRVFET